MHTMHSNRLTGKHRDKQVEKQDGNKQDVQHRDDGINSFVLSNDLQVHSNF
jgi:hypothetical protein